MLKYVDGRKESIIVLFAVPALNAEIRRWQESEHYCFVCSAGTEC
jgi:hypothetical protein